ncbi:hypothetical protein M0208_07995 [Sphingomonas sp. SUN019]|uniref:hypothetical protein n=1 Tax=Sphingomonas sp. SUN019 TaxID=2937788 RepID=UPI0021647CED|nr:hypothetical protein [Sphingomonas sp. SUN019]UVO50460.1 hypothetical protein M0208_07995 [Sphingomonas sp. SUN019]
MTLEGQLEPGYSIAFDRPNGLMRIAVRGLWTMQTVAAFIGEGLAATAAAHRTHPIYDTLVDARDFPVQAAQVTDGLAEIFRVGMESNAGRTAIVSQSHLGKMQGDRLNPNPRQKIFLAEADAIAWLAEPQLPKTD